MTTPSTARRTGILLALATAAISGFSIFVNGRAVRAFGDATAYTTVKNVVAGILILGVVLIGLSRGARLDRPRTARQWGWLAAIGLFGGSVPFVLFFEGLARADSSQAAFLHKSLILWVALLAVVVLGERLSWLHWLAVGLLVVGQVGLAGGVTGFGTPEALILAATLLWSVEVVVAKRLLAGLSSWTVALARMGLGSVVLLIWTATTGHLAMPTPTQWAWALLTGLLLAGYVSTWFAALKRAPAVDVTAVLVLAAPVTVGLNAVVNGAAVDTGLGWLALLVGSAGWFLLRSARRPEEIRA
jgi:drug/metabolite transporter (DMT)-like permease